MESPRGFNDPWLHLAAPLLKQTDLLLLLARRPDFTVRFGQESAFAPGCRVVQVDADASALRAGLAVGSSPIPPWWPGSSRTPPAAGVGAPRLGRGGAAGARHRARRLGGAAARGRDADAPAAGLRGAPALVDRGAILVVDGGEFGQWVQAGVEAGPRLINGVAGAIGARSPWRSRRGSDIRSAR
jgi:acetolactate synthase-1/2/3 large subunit